MRMVLGVSTLLGIVGVATAFGLFYMGERVFHIDRLHIQTLMYLKLSVAGHLTIFMTRTRGPFWSIRPARILWIAVLGTQIIATLIAVYGLFMAPLGWKWAGFVWGYAILCFLVTDRIKLLVYRIVDPIKKADAKKPTKDRLTSPDSADPKVKPDTESVDKGKDAPKPENQTNAPKDIQMAEQIAVKASNEPKVDTKADTTHQSRPLAKSDDQPLPESAAQSRRETEKPVEGTTDLTEQTVKRVHELYEELGREQVQAVEALEQRARERDQKGEQHGGD